MSWWNASRIELYSRAAEHGDFHRRLGDMLVPLFEGCDDIVELGCGLGYMTGELCSRGCNAKGYDEDPMAVDFATGRFPRCSFARRDCYRLGEEADAALAVFFGRIGQEGSLEALLSSCRRRLVYVCNEHCQWNRCTWKVTARVRQSLDARGVGYECTTGHLRFDQLLEDEDELDVFIRENYESRGRTFDLDIERGTGRYPIRVVNDKSFGIFTIEKEDAR